MAVTRDYRTDRQCGRVRCGTARDLSQGDASRGTIRSMHILQPAFVSTASLPPLSGGGDLVDHRFGCQTIRRHHGGTAAAGIVTVAVDARCLDDIDPAAPSPAPCDGKHLQRGRNSR
jgi:hypothetical protein